MKRLARRLDVPQYAAVGLMESLWKLAERDTPLGDIGKLSDEDIVLALDWRGDETVLIEALVKSEWLDRDVPGCRLWVHDWHEHSEDAVDLRLTRATLRYANGSLPRMKRLSDVERAAHLMRFAEKQEAEEAVRTNSASVRTDAHKSALPSPSPIPSPSPSPENPNPLTDALALEPAGQVINFPQPAPAVNLDGIARQIVCAHPKAVARQFTAVDVTGKHLAPVLAAIAVESMQSRSSRESAAHFILAATQGYAAAVQQWPPGEQKFASGLDTFYTERVYRQDPQEWTYAARDTKRNRSQERSNGNLDALRRAGGLG